RSWARRQLALGWASQGEGKLREALDLLDRAAAGHTPTPAEERTRLLVLGQQPGRRREALRQIERNLARAPLSTEDQLPLAQLYEAEGEHPEARALLLKLLTEHERNGQYLAAQVRSLLARR